MRELLLVCIGNFFGGGARFLVSKAVQSCVAVSFPWHNINLTTLAIDACAIPFVLVGAYLGIRLVKFFDKRSGKPVTCQSASSASSPPLSPSSASS